MYILASKDSRFQISLAYLPVNVAGQIMRLHYSCSNGVRADERIVLFFDNEYMHIRLPGYLNSKDNLPKISDKLITMFEGKGDLMDYISENLQHKCEVNDNNEYSLTPDAFTVIDTGIIVVLEPDISIDLCGASISNGTITGSFVVDEQLSVKVLIE